MVLGQPCLLSECAEIFDGDLQPCLPMYDSENFHISEHGNDDKIAVFSNHIQLQIFVDLHVIFRWKICLGFGRCMEQQDIQFRFYDSHFQPSNCTQKSFSSSKISSHTSSPCLVEDI